MVIFFLINLLLLTSSVKLAKFFSQGETVSHYLLSVLALFFSQIVTVVLFPGIFYCLNLPTVTLSSLVIFIAIALFLKNKYLKPVPHGLHTELINNKFVLFCICVLSGFGLIKVLINLVNPPFGWDSLNYHFTFPVEWLKHGNLNNPITINDDLGPTYYPLNGSFIYFWFILPLKNVFLADLGQIPFFIMSFIALYGISRKLNIDREYSFYAASLFTITPNYFKQTEIAYVDVMVCAWFLLSFYFLLSFFTRKTMRDALFFAIGLGILVGTKTAALPYAGVLSVFFVAAVVMGYKPLGLRKAFLCILTLLLFTVVFGGYTYIRNFIQTGSPFYPMDVRLFGRTIFRGVYDKSVYTSHIRPGDYALSKILFSEGLGAGLIIFLIPGFFAFVLRVIKREFSLDKLFVLLSLPLLYLIWRYLIPLANLRYLYPAIAIGYIMPFYVLSAKRRLRVATRILVALCFIASSFEIATRLELVFSLLISLLLFFSVRRTYSFLKSLKTAQWIIICSSLLLGLYFLNNDYNKKEYDRYVKMVKYSGFWPEATLAWKWLNENSSGNNIAYVGRPVPFPLYGTNFKNNVFYVSVNKTEPVMLHYFPHSRYAWGPDFMELHKNLEKGGNYREYPDYNIWLANLKKRKTDYLFIYSLHQTKEISFPVEDVWARTHPENFALSFINPTIRIYKLK